MNESGQCDGTLLRQWVEKGTEESFRSLVDRYAGLVHHAAMRITGDHALARDAAQGTFILLAKHARLLAERPNLGGWLHVAAINQSKNLLRSQMREIRKRKEWEREAEYQPHPASGGPLYASLDLALAGLPSADREALLLRYYRALPVKDVAAAMGLSAEAAKKRLARAVERLRGRLSAKGVVPSAGAVVAALTGLSGDASAGALLAPGICRHALLHAAPASFWPSLLSLALIMNKKAIAVIVATSSLFIGAGILVVGKSSPERKKAPSSAEAGNPETSRPISSEAPSAIRNRRGRPAKPVAMRDLEERYGEARAKRAARVGSTYLRVLDSTISYAERSGPYDASFNISEAELGPLFDRLNLSEDQEVEMEKIFQGHSYEEARKMKAFAEKMRQDTPALIEAILASDAYARGAIDKAAYEAATQPAYQALVAAGAGKTPLGSLSAGEPGEASRNRNQPEVQRKIRQILKPDQVGELDAYLDENQIDPTGSAPPSLANVLPLEKLEEVERGMDARAAIMEHTEALMNELEKLKPSEGK